MLNPITLKESEEKKGVDNMPDLRDDPTPTEHTWQEATDNIRSGNIALKNNKRFAVANYKYLSNYLFIVLGHSF